MSLGTPSYFDEESAGPSPSFQRLINGVSLAEESSIPISCREYLYLSGNLGNPDFGSFEALQALAMWGQSYVDAISQYWNAYLQITRGPLNLQAPGVQQQLNQIAATCPLYQGVAQTMDQMEAPLIKQTGNQAQAQATLKQRNPQYNSLVGFKANIESALTKIATHRAQLGYITFAFERSGARLR